MMLLIALIYLCSSDWEISNTGIFKVFGHNKFDLDQQGNSYILDPSESTVLKYDPESKFVKRIGRSGQGPDGIEHAYSIAIVHGRLYVQGAYHVNEFRLDGRALNKHKNSVNGIPYVLEKLSHGWVGVSNKPQRFAGLKNNSNRKDLQELCWFSNDFSEKKVLLTWPIPSSPYTRTGLKYNPVYPQDKLVIAKDRTSFYFNIQSQSHIVLFGSDLKQQTVDVPFNRVVFDRDWGLQMLEEFKRENPGLKVKENFPEFFPVIRNMGVFANGFLGVEVTKTAHSSEIFYYSAEGLKVENIFNAEALKRTLAVVGNVSYLIFQDAATEEFGVARVKSQDVDKFLKTNPNR